MLKITSIAGPAGNRVAGCIASSFILALGIGLGEATLQCGAQTPSCKPRTYTFVTLAAPFPGVDQTLTFGINDLGTVVGEYHDPAGFHGFILDNGKYTPVNVPFPGARDTGVIGINIFRQVVGSYDANGITHGFLLSNGSFSALDFPASHVIATFPRGINALGAIVGTYNDGTESHGFLLDQGKFTAIDVPFAGVVWTQALGINDRGEIVGSYGTSDDRIHAFGRARNGTFANADLPFPGGALETVAYTINNAEQVAGAGFLYDHAVFTPLSDLSPSAVNAVALGMNDLGVMVGIYGSSTELSFMLTPQ